MAHSHSQIMGLPLVPPLVSTRLNSMKKFYNMAASYAFEVWIVPRDHTAHFHEIDHEKAVGLGRLLKVVLEKLSKQLNDPPYNFMIQATSLNLSSSCAPAHWFLQIVPHLSVTGGFEIGTGCFINPVFPEDAANVLREVDGAK